MAKFAYAVVKKLPVKNLPALRKKSLPGPTWIRVRCAPAIIEASIEIASMLSIEAASRLAKAIEAEHIGLGPVEAVPGLA